MEKYIVYEYNENASLNYRGTRFMTRYTGEEKPDTNNNLIVVAKDVSEDDAYTLINKVSEKNLNAYLNDMPDELRSIENDAFIKSLLNGNIR